MKAFGFFIILLAIFSCDKDSGLSQQEEAQQLQNQFTAIKAMAESVTCENSFTWAFTEYGNKACGGPQGYIAYSKTIDLTLFLSMVKAHQEAEKAFNTKWSITSDCSISTPPEGVKCEGGKAVLIYDINID